jgi:hypothetical protein
MRDPLENRLQLVGSTESMCCRQASARSVATR